MMPLMFRKKTLPCGFQKSNKLAGLLAHYKDCPDAECKRRKASWDAIMERFKVGKPLHGEDFS